MPPFPHPLNSEYPVNDCSRCIWRRTYCGTDKHWCRQTGVHIEGQVERLDDGSYRYIPDGAAPAWCPGMKDNEHV